MIWPCGASRPLLRALLLLSALLGVCTANAQFFWISTTSGNWSNPAMWQGGSVPPVGGGSGVSLTFTNSGAAAWTATNDRGNPFILNLLNLNSTSTGVFSLLSASGNGLLFQGGNAGVTTSGPGSATIDIGGSGLTLGADITFSGSGTGLYVVNAVIGEAGGPHSIMLALDQAATLKLTQSNTFSGGVILNSGNLVAVGATSLGAGSLSINGGTIQTLSDCNTPITLLADLVSSGLYVGPSGTITSATSGTGMNVIGPLSVKGVASHNGPTSASQSTLLLTGNGALPNTSQINLVNDQATIDNVTVNQSDRLNDAAPLLLRDSTLAFNSGTGGTGERIGPLQVQGSSAIYFTTRGDGPTTLSSPSIAGVGQGHLLVSGRNLGAAPGPQVCNLYFDTPPEMVGGEGGSGTTNISIVPGVFADWNTTTDAYIPEGRTLATYGANGLRFLDPSTEFNSGFAAGGNVRISSGFQNNTSYTINSLVGYASSIIGSAATLHVTSATVMWVSGELDNSLDFGTRQGNVWGQAFDFVGKFIGSNGIRITSNSVTLWGDNTPLTGPLYSSGNLTFRNLISLPGTGDIQASGSLRYVGTAPPTVTRNIVMTGDLGLTGFTFGGIVSGNHMLTLNGERLTGANTYTGNTMFTGTGFVSSDSIFGPSPLLILNGGGPTLEGNWTTSRPMIIQQFSSGAINTGTFTATLNGPFTIAAPLTKNGTGMLALNNVAAASSSTVNINGGTVVLNSPASNVSFDVGTSANTATFGGTGPAKDITLESTGTISPTGTLAGSSLTWNGGGHMAFDLGPTSDAISLSGALTKAGSGSYTFDFTTSPNLTPGTYTLMSFGSTTFTASNFSYTAPPNVIGSFSIVGNQLKFTVQMIVSPNSYQIFRGLLLSGGLSQLLNSDNQYLVLDKGLTLMSGEPPVSLIVIGTSPVAQPSSIKIHVEAHASESGLRQTTELWDYTANQWVFVDNRSVSTADQIAEAFAPLPSKFVDPSTHQMKARFSYLPSGILASSGWQISFDQAIWIVG